MYKETRLRVTYYMAKLTNRWIEAAWRRETIYPNTDSESRDRSPEYEIMVVPLVIESLGGGIRQIMANMGKLFENGDLLERTICEMQKTVLMDSDTTSRNVLSGLL